MITIENNEIVYDFDTNKDLANKKNWKYILKKFVRNRTLPQNNYLWWCIYKLIAENTGEDEEVIHEQMRYKFLKDNTWNLPRIKSTTELSTIEFNEYIDKVVLFWNEFGCITFPTPDEYQKL